MRLRSAANNQATRRNEIIKSYLQLGSSSNRYAPRLPQQETKSSTKQLAPMDPILGPENLLKTGFAQKGLPSSFQRGWPSRCCSLSLEANGTLELSSQFQHMIWHTPFLKGLTIVAVEPWPDTLWICLRSFWILCCSSTGRSLAATAATSALTWFSGWTLRESGLACRSRTTSDQGSWNCMASMTFLANTGV